MILKMKQWCEGLIIAIIISIIIEIMIPEGNNKKYAKVIIGIYILFVMINPILELMGEEIKVDIFENYQFEEAYVAIDNNIKDVYILGIEESIKSDLEDKGINVKEVKVEVNSSYEEINRVVLKLKKIPNDMNEIYAYFHDNFSLTEQNIEIRSSE